MFSSQPKSKDEEELRRLFYVALTRAEKHLYISYSRFKNDGKELEPSMFIAEILERAYITSRKSALSLKKYYLNSAALQFSEAKLRKLKRLKKILLPSAG